MKRFVLERGKPRDYRKGSASLRRDVAFAGSLFSPWHPDREAPLGPGRALGFCYLPGMSPEQLS